MASAAVCVYIYTCIRGGFRCKGGTSDEGYTYIHTGERDEEKGQGVERALGNNDVSIANPCPIPPLFFPTPRRGAIREPRGGKLAKIQLLYALDFLGLPMFFQS